MHRSLIVLMLALAGLLALASCSKNTKPAASTGFGTVTLQLTDAPAAYDHVYLDVREVTIHGIGGDGGSDSLGDSDDTLEGRHDGDDDGGGDGRGEQGDNDSTDVDHGGGDSTGDHHGDGGGHGRHGNHGRHGGGGGTWTTLEFTPQIIDLLELRNGVFKTLGTGRVPAGRYNAIQLALGDSNTIVVDGVTYPLVVLGCKDSVFTMRGKFEVPTEGTVDVGIDFDVCRSIHHRPDGTWVLLPVARIEQLSTTGSIAGQISPADVPTWAYAIQGADTIATTISNNDGRFKLVLLPPGEYKVHLAPTTDTLLPQDIEHVNVVAGSTTRLGTIVLAAPKLLPSALTR